MRGLFSHAFTSSANNLHTDMSRHDALLPHNGCIPPGEVVRMSALPARLLFRQLLSGAFALTLIGNAAHSQMRSRVSSAALMLDTAPANPTADQILTEAKSQATAEHKNILLVFSASWCGPCHLLEAFLHDPATGPIIDKNFVLARFDVGEHPGDKRHSNTLGAEALRASLDGANPGYPFLVILNPAGKVIVNSYRPVAGHKHDAETNIGYPAAPAEIDWFMQMLHQSAPAISMTEADTIRRWLQQRGRP
jgi:hypothetical protein